jgi:preprotein translocase subunit SecY
LATADVSAPRPDPVFRGLITLGAVFVLFLGTHIPLPGLSADFLHRAAPGPALGRLSIFALGVTPIIFARTIVELCRLICPPLRRLAARQGGAARLGRLSRILALATAAFQAYGVARFVEGVPNFVDEPGWMFRIGIVATAIGATALLIWLADFATRHGTGDGLLILFAAPIAARTPQIVALWVELARTGAIPAEPPLAGALLTGAGVVLLAVSSLAQGRTLRPAPGSNLANANFDVWPALLAVSGFSMADTLSKMIMSPETATSLILRLAVAAGLIALFTALRSRGGEAQGQSANSWSVGVATTIVCVGAILFAYVYQISSEGSGFAIVFVVAAILSCFSRRVRL